MSSAPIPHAPSYYAAVTPPFGLRPALPGPAETDVCVIGAGYTGLSAALHLARAGRRVIVLDAARVGWGASGRNGGQLHTGQRRDQSTLEDWFGRDRAHRLFELAEEAKRLVKDLIAEHAIDCDWTEGLIHAIHKPAYLTPYAEEFEKLARDYRYEGLTRLDRDELAAAIGTEAYHGGWRDAGAGHLNPLAFAFGLARAAEAAGATIHEATRALGIRSGPRPVVDTDQGPVTADAVVIACNGYLAGLEPEVESRIMPIHNYILATEPLGGRARRLIPDREAIADTRFVVHYWRLSADDRLVFGGGETYSRNFPNDIKAFVRRHLLKIYPDLAGVRIDYGWGGTLAVTMNRMPLFARPRPGVYAAAGYSGQGIGLATFAGKLIAEAIQGDQSRFDTFATLPMGKFPGGKWLRYPSLVLAMSWYALRDRI